APGAPSRGGGEFQSAPAPVRLARVVQARVDQAPRRAVRGGFGGGDRFPLGPVAGVGDDGGRVWVGVQSDGTDRGVGVGDGPAVVVDRAALVFQPPLGDRGGGHCGGV